MIQKVKYSLADLQNATDEELISLVYDKATELYLGTFGETLEYNSNLDFPSIFHSTTQYLSSKRKREICQNLLKKIQSCNTECPFFVFIKEINHSHQIQEVTCFEKGRLVG